MSAGHQVSISIFSLCFTRIAFVVFLSAISFASFCSIYLTIDSPTCFFRKTAQDVLTFMSSRTFSTVICIVVPLVLSLHPFLPFFKHCISKMPILVFFLTLSSVSLFRKYNQSPVCLKIE